MIQVERLSKTYGGTSFAVKDVSFDVRKGEVVGFLGPNGAGKSTTLRIVAGFLGASSGRVTVGGHDIVEDPLLARAATGYMPEAVPLYQEMRVIEYLRFRAELKGVSRRERPAFIDSAMQKARVADVSETLIGHLSKGYRQRVGLADALVSRPPILILDEPTAGLDPNQIREVRKLVRDLGKEHAVLLSTHILSEVEASCDRALVIAKGKLVAQGTLDELRKLRRSRGIKVVLGKGLEAVPAAGAPDVVERVLTALRALPTVASVERDELALSVTWHKSVEDVGAAAEEAARAVTALGAPLRELSPTRATLEEVFAELTTHDVAANGAEAALPMPARAS